MPRTGGMLDLEDLKRLVVADEVDTVLVVFSDAYGVFLGKRYDAGFFLEHVVESGAHGCDYLLTVDIEMQPVAGYELASWDQGYGDMHLVPDLRTLRKAAWLEKTALVICDLRDRETHGRIPEAPRTILRAQIEKLHALGYATLAGSELEYYILDCTYRDAARASYHNLGRSGWYLEDYHILQGTRHEKLHAPVRCCLKRSGVPVESSKGEWGLGQHELNIQCADALEMADRHSIYKQCVKEIADGLDISVTFMAKYDADSAGSSCHLHVSLWCEGKNAFSGSEKLGPVCCSDVFRWFLAGWIAHVPDLMVCYAPTVNSYKRYRPSSWAPTNLAWSYDNRTAGFRVVGQDKGLRIECRIPGADCNPYLAYAACLASGMAGIQSKMEPPPVFSGDAYKADEVARVPSSLREATDLFEQSEFARQAFGERVVRHYVHFFRTEQAAFDAAVTDWERKRYFERI